jgi:hypothetical protein
MKNLPTARFNLIPFLIADLARGKDFYIYTAKGRFSKGERACAYVTHSSMRACIHTHTHTHTQTHTNTDYVP